MGIKGVPALTNIEYHMIAADGLQRNRHGT
jgi:hypothetical protein